MKNRFEVIDRTACNLKKLAGLTENTPCIRLDVGTTPGTTACPRREPVFL